MTESPTTQASFTKGDFESHLLKIVNDLACGAILLEPGNREKSMELVHAEYGSLMELTEAYVRQEREAEGRAVAEEIKGLRADAYGVYGPEPETVHSSLGSAVDRIITERYGKTKL